MASRRVPFNCSRGLETGGSAMEVDVNVDVPETESVTEQEARTELDRLLSDPQFHSTERNRNFLRFVAREMFEGRAAAVKAYTIAVDVFGRPCSFDPTTDPIVRIEATRLRASLAQYYEARAEEGSVRMSCRVGGIYRFSRRRRRWETVSRTRRRRNLPTKKTRRKGSARSTGDGSSRAQFFLPRPCPGSSGLSQIRGLCSLISQASLSK